MENARIYNKNKKSEEKKLRMQKLKKRAIACMAICALLSGCASQNKQNDVQDNVENEQLKVTTITEVFGDGQKPSAVALEYPNAIDASSLSTDDFEIENQTITDVYTNSEAALTDSNVSGNYVILKLAYENTVSADSMGGGAGRNGGQRPDDDQSAQNGQKEEKMQNGDSGQKVDDAQSDNTSGQPDKDGGEVDGGKLQGGERDAGADGGQGRNMGGGKSSETVSTLSVVQKGEVAGTDGTIYPASETAVESSEQIDLVVQDFQLLEYTDSNGNTIPYSIYLPEDYDESKKYPLVFFVADASANGDNTTRNITQGNGATIWATPEEQAKHECIVVSPQYTNTLIDSIGALVTDDNVWSDGLTLVYNMLQYVIDEYSVDENRIYGTGQSQGCMTNIALSDKYPDLFAAQFLVAGQWNVEEMAAMKDKNLWIAVCEGDTKAYPGMNEATEKWESLGSSVARSDMWDSTSTAEQFDELVKQMEDQNCKINYTVFEGGSHTYTWSVAYNIEGIRDWLFAQTKE